MVKHWGVGVGDGGDAASMLNVVDLTCRFCGERCFVPLLTIAPPAVMAAYQQRGVSLLATCEAGMAFERQVLGACYEDVAVAEYEASVNLVSSK